jgi:hypothetical protein
MYLYAQHIYDVHYDFHISFILLYEMTLLCSLFLKSQTFYCKSNLSGDREGSSARHVSNLQVSISLDYTRRGHLRRKALPQTHHH